MAAVAALCALLAASIGVQHLGLELSWSAEAAGILQGDPASAIARWEQWPDPAFGVAAADYALAVNDTASEVRLAQELYSRVAWSADADIKVAQMSQMLSGGPYASQVPSPRAALEAGRMADPTSGLWDAVSRILSQKK